jgi:hypothetical protein
LRIFGVLPTVDFNNQAGIVADKICDVGPDRNLPPK